jgi:hypothetical protein
MAKAARRRVDNAVKGAALESASWTPTPPPDPRLLERIRAEYLEMPGLRLRAEQLQRLCGVEPTMCQMVLDTLVEANFLCMKSDSTYSRLMDGDKPRPRPA